MHSSVGVSPVIVVRQLVFTLLTVWSVGAGASTPVKMIDAHSHYTSADADAFSPPEVIAMLDAAGVSRVVVAGSPPESVCALYDHAPDRVIPLLGLYRSHAGKALWMHDPGVPERLEARLRDGAWAGIGELHIFSRDADSKIFAEVVRIADRNGLMLLIHGDAAIIDRAFEIAPNVRILWAHLGTVPAPGLVGRMLERHNDRGLWVDTSVRDERIAPDGKLADSWRELFERFPDRFMVAVDTFSVNRWGRYGEVVSEIRAWVSQLPEPMRSGLLRDNARVLFAPYLERAPSPAELSSSENAG